MNPNEKPKGEINMTADGYKFYQISDISPAALFKIAKVLKEKCGITQFKEPVSTADETVAIYRKEKMNFLLGWDTWTGLYFSARDIEGNIVVEDAAVYLNEVFNNGKL